MAKKDRYPGLNKEQQTKLKTLIAEVATLPTAYLLRESFGLRGVDPATDEGRAEMDRGRTHEGEVVTKTISDDGYRVTGGLKVDAQQRLLLKVAKKDISGKLVYDEAGNVVMEEKAFDVTDRGTRKIQEIVERNWREIRKNAIEQLRQHCLVNSGNIPPPEAVEFELMTRPGGYDPEEDLGNGPTVQLRS